METEDVMDELDKLEAQMEAEEEALNNAISAFPQVVNQPSSKTGIIVALTLCAFGAGIGLGILARKQQAKKNNGKKDEAE